MTDVVQLEKSGGIATVTLDRPKALNSLDQQIAEQLAEVLSGLEHDAEAQVVVLRGAGKAFMAGGDVKAFHEAASQGPDVVRSLVEHLIPTVHRSILILNRMRQPVIASVHGAAAGFGLSLVLATDLVVAAEDARFTLAYSKIGTSPDGSSTYTLPRLVGLKKAMEIALLADMFSAAEAERLGLVNRVVPPDDLEQETTRLAERLVSGPLHAYAGTKRLLRDSFSNSLETQLQREEETFAGCAATADFAEGTAAFVEKREAKFRGA